MLISLSKSYHGRSNVKLKENNRGEHLKATIKVLLTFAGFRDSFYRSTPEYHELKGPIVNLLELRAYDRVILFAAPNLPEGTGDAFREIKVAHPDSDVAVLDCPIDDPTDYVRVFSWLRKHFRDVVGVNEGAEYYFATASGTLQLYAVCVMLAAGREIPSKILQEKAPILAYARIIRRTIPMTIRSIRCECSIECSMNTCL